MASTAVPFSLQIISDTELEEIETDTVELDIAIKYSKGTEIDKVIDIGYYILYQDETGKSRFFTIVNSDKFSNKKLVEIYAEDASLDLLNNVVLPYEADKAYPISHYISKFAGDSGFEIGLNELGDSYTRKLVWTGEETATKRILSVCTQFDHAELEYAFEINGLTVTKKLINVHKKRGRDTGISLRLKEELNEITVSKSIENLATGLYVTGGTEEGKEEPVTLKGYKYDDGRFYVQDGYLLDRKSYAVWNRFGIANDSGTIAKHITKTYSFETTSQSELCNRAVAQLTKLAEVEVNFTVDIALLPEGIRIGDTVNIIDLGEQLFLQARVLKLEKSRTGRKAKAVLGEYLIQQSGIHSKVSELADKIASMKESDSSFLWVRYADDDKGTGFSAVPTNKTYMAVKSVINQPIPSDNPADYAGLWVKIQGNSGTDGTDGKPSYTWIRYADTVSGSGISSSPTGKAYIGLAYNKATPTPSNTPADYQWFLAKGTDGIDGKDGTDGKDGQQVYFFTAWANTANGSSGFTTNKDNSVGKKYLGTYSSTNPVQSTNPSSYAWVELAGVFADKIAEIDDKFKTLAIPIVSATTPTAAAIGQQWWKVDSLGNVIGFYKWDGSKWTEQTIQQSVLNIKELNAVDIFGSEITGSVLTGSSFLNYWDKSETNGRTGILKIENGMLHSNYYLTGGGMGNLLLDENQFMMELFDDDGTELASASLLVNGIQMAIIDPYTGKRKTAFFGTDGIQMTDESQPYGTVNLSYKDLLQIPATSFTSSMFKSGFSQYATSGTNQPIYSRKNGLVQLSGAITNTVVVPANYSGTPMATLPVGLRPDRTVNTISQGSNTNRYLLTIETNGNISCSRYGTTSNIDIPVGTWLNIACTYAAGD